MTDHKDIPVITDCGSLSCNVGFGGDDAPTAVFPSLVGSPKLLPRPGAPHILGKIKDFYVGQEAYLKAAYLTLKPPIDRGVVINWESMERVYNHIFSEVLNVDPTEHTVLLAESPLNPKADRERMAQIMFETFQVPAVCLANSAELSLYASERLTGCVLECGGGVTHSVAIYDGKVQPKSTRRLDLGGNDLTEYLMKTLTESGYSFTTSAERRIVGDVKKNLSYVALDFDQEMQKTESVEKIYELPDGNVLVVGNERFRTPEPLFQPLLISNETPGVVECIFQTISSCDADKRKELYGNILLTGGGSLFPGFAERLTKEVTALAPFDVKVEVVASTDHQHSAWVGGSMLSTQTSFRDMWACRAEYDESGPSVVHHKCVQVVNE